MRGQAYAWLNLTYHFWKHVLTRAWLRAFRPGRDLRRFERAVRPEGYLPLTAAERERFPEFMGCIHCGLCTLACPALLEVPASAWAEPWTFVAGPSRALDQATLGAAAAGACGRCAECSAICPTGVPIPELAATLTRLADARGV